MIKYYHEKYKMMNSLSDFLKLKQVEIDTIIPAVADKRSTFLNIFEEIVHHPGILSSKKSAYTKLKRELRSKLTEEAYTVGKATELYYTMVVKDVTLSERASFSRTEMTRLSTDALLVKARLVSETALPVKDLLLPYGVEQARVEALPGHIDAFFAAKQLPRESRAQSKNAGKDLIALFKLADEAIEELDLLLAVLRYNHSSLFFHYQLSRKIQSMPTNHILKQGLLQPGASKAASYARGYLKAEMRITLINESARTKGAALQFYFAAKRGDLPASTQPIIEVPAGAEKTIAIAKHGFSADTPVLMVFNPSAKKIRWKTRVVLKENK